MHGSWQGEVAAGKGLLQSMARGGEVAMLPREEFESQVEIKK
jgi:hypothetical protein